MSEMAGAGGRGRQADERFIKGKEKMMWRAYEVGPLSSSLMPLATDGGKWTAAEGSSHTA